MHPSFKKPFWLISAAFIMLTGCSNPSDYPQKILQTTANTSEQSLNDLQSLPYISNGPRTHKEVALTFDADMTPYMLKLFQSGKVKSYYDQRIVDTLNNDQAHATFFITGMWAETYPDILQSFAHNKNFEIEDHSYDHAAFSVPCYGLGLTVDAKSEITKAQTAIEKIAGITPIFFRFPGGCFKADDLELVHSFGLIPVQWDVVSGDAYLKNPAEVAKQVLSQVQSGSIVVMHLNGAPNAPATAEALPVIIKKLQSEGYTFVTLKELL